MSKYYLIDGWWKDDLTCFHDYLVTDDTNEFEEDSALDSMLFHYGLGEKQLTEAMDEDSPYEFVITRFEETNLEEDAA